MKKNKILKLVVLFVIFELTVIVLLKGYEIIRDLAVESVLTDEGGIPDREKEEEDTEAEENSKTPIIDQLKPYQPKFEFVNVDVSYFDDALFIGDSRTVALRAFGSFPNAHYFARTGIGINSLFEYPATDEATNVSLKYRLSERQYGKIYIMIGVNDLSYGTLTSFADSYFSAIDTIREYQPNAIIYVQSIVGITEKEERYSPNRFNNQTVLNRNAILKARCNDESIVYLDLFSVYADESGYLNPEYSADGLHIKPDYTYIWEDFLKSHAIKINE